MITPVHQSSPAAADGKPTLSIGQRLGNYSILRCLDAAQGRWIACEVSSLEEVQLHARAVTAATERRRATWEKLQQFSEGPFVRAIEAFEEDGVRYELTALPAGSNLHEWMSCHQLSLPMLESLVQQIGSALHNLHEAGLVLLRLRPDAVYICEDEHTDLRVVLSDLTEAALFAPPGLVPVAVNPYYAPPEAAGLSEHAAADTLCAWDWWELGRLLQEIVHGRHIYGLIFERDVAERPAILEPRAEALLLERDQTSVRAGAVELLPETVGPRTRRLLRGLLASSRDGRWRWLQLQHWLRNEPPPPADRYDLPRHARLFFWRGQAMTLAEASDYFSQRENFADGVEQLFPDPANRAALSYFLADTPQYRGDHARLAQLLAWIDMTPWQDCPLEIRREIVAGLVWLIFAEDTPQRRLTVLGWRIDPAGLKALLAELPAETAIAVVRALCASPCLQLLKPLDATAARALESLAGSGFEAVALAHTRSWIAAVDYEAEAGLLRTSLDADKVLQAAAQAVTSTYATCRDEMLAALLANKAPGRAEQIVLVFTRDRAGQYGYVTHLEWHQERHRDLKQRIDRLAAALFWRRLAPLLCSSPALCGTWPVAALIWLLPATLAVVAGRWSWGILLISAGGLGHRWAAGEIRRNLHRHLPQSPPWTGRDGVRRCQREVAALLGEETSRSVAEIAAELARLTAEIVAVPLNPRPPRPEAPARFRALWLGSLSGTCLPFLTCLAIITGVQPLVSDNNTPLDRASPTSARHALVKTVSSDGRTELYEIEDDGFGGKRRGPLRAWPLPPNGVHRSFAVTSQRPTTPAEAAQALVSAELLLDPYPRNGLDVLLAVPVSDGDPNRIGIVIYEPKSRELGDPNTYYLAEPPAGAAWYNLAGHPRVAYLGLPPGDPDRFQIKSLAHADPIPPATSGEPARLLLEAGK